MNDPRLEPRPRRRTASKEARRRQLINATIDSIASKGISGTTLADVSKQAGLSHGIVNLHFKNKETLFVETLRFLSNNYKKAWEKKLAAERSPADRLRALIEVDFSTEVSERRKLAVWFAFWGEAKSRPTYRKICEDHDDDYHEMLVGLCREMVQKGGYDDIDPEGVATGLDAMVEGLWLDIMMGYGGLTRRKAKSICLDYLHRCFPQHIAMEEK